MLPDLNEYMTGVQRYCPEDHEVQVRAMASTSFYTSLCRSLAWPCMACDFHLLHGNERNFVRYRSMWLLVWLYVRKMGGKDEGKMKLKTCHEYKGILDTGSWSRCLPWESTHVFLSCNTLQYVQALYLSMVCWWRAQCAWRYRQKMILWILKAISSMEKWKFGSGVHFLAFSLSSIVSDSRLSWVYTCLDAAEKCCCAQDALWHDQEN